jgi:hypothetical protein
MGLRFSSSNNRDVLWRRGRPSATVVARAALDGRHALTTAIQSAMDREVVHADYGAADVPLAARSLPIAVNVLGPATPGGRELVAALRSVGPNAAVSLRG